MKLIVGLGNPGKKYTNTRHNLGFMVLDKIVNQFDKLRVNAEQGRSIKKKDWKKVKDSLIFQKDEVLFAKPQTFMNDSGKAIEKLKNKFRIEISDIIIIRDDIDIPFEVIRTRFESSAAGHKGVKSIIDELGIEKISQIKIGIGDNKEVDLDKYVLQNFNAEEKKLLPKILDQTVRIVLEFISSDLKNTSYNVGG